MRKTRRILIGLLAVIILVAAAHLLFTPHQPLYRGKTVNQWFKLLASSGVYYPAFDPKKSEPFQGVLHFGDQAVPCVAAGFLRRETAWDRLRLTTWTLLPERLRRQAPPPLTSSQINDAAVAVAMYCNEDLRKNIARAVAPSLLAEMKHPRNLDRSQILGFMQFLTPDADLIMSDLNRFLKDPDPRVREAAGFVICEYGREAKPALTNLMDTINDPNLQTRIFAIYTLGAIGPEASLAVPTLEKCLKDEGVRVSAAFALWRIDRQTNVALQILPEVVSSNPDASYELGEIGPAAAEAVPALIEAAKHSPAQNRLAACQALWKIDSSLAPLIIRELVDMLNDPRTGNYELEHGAGLLGKIGPAARGATGFLTALLNHPEAEIRAAAAKALKQIDPEAAVSADPKQNRVQH